VLTKSEHRHTIESKVPFESSLGLPMVTYYGTGPIHHTFLLGKFIALLIQDFAGLGDSLSSEQIGHRPQIADDYGAVAARIVVAPSASLRSHFFAGELSHF
jgi:hypothetical protein